MPRKPKPKPVKIGPKMFFHKASKQWCAKFNGKFIYFGMDQEAAVDLYRRELSDRLADRDPRAPDDSDGSALTVLELTNRFLTTKKILMDNGEFSPRTWRDYWDMTEFVIEAFGKNMRVVDLTSGDFERLRKQIAAGVGVVTLGNRIQHTRTMFKYAFDDGLIPKPVCFGVAFKKPSRNVLRSDRQKRGSKVLAVEECRALLGLAKRQMKAMIYLGLNCGFGQSDLAALPRSAVDLKTGWVDFPRPKTSVPRRCPLWPETVEALKACWKNRPEPKSSADKGLVFLTVHGLPWVRFYERESDRKGTPRRAVGIDSVTLEFKKLLKKAGIKRPGIGPYALRHTFRTIADGSLDQPACDLIMGHSRQDMASHYRQGIVDDRLRAVVDVVRAWLIGDEQS